VVAAADNFSAKAALVVPEVLADLAAAQVVLGAAVEEECLEGAADWVVKR
jgi:hypothetical protein